MSNILRGIIGMVAMAILTCPLLWEPWFSFRLWVVISIYGGLRYFLFCIREENMGTATKSLIESLKAMR